MSTPFDTIPAAPAVSGVAAASDKQLGFIARLLNVRDWQNSGQPKYIERVVVVGSAIAKAERVGSPVNVLLGDWDEKPLSKKGASALIDWLLDQPAARKAESSPAPSDLPSADEVPAGRYAVATDEGAVNELAFYKVDRPQEGRWAGYVFVKHLISDAEQRLSFAASKSVLGKIAKAGAAEASALYGHEIGECGVCGKVLTNDVSRERGIGPICAAKAGW